MIVYILEETWPDYIENSVYRNKEDAISRLQSLVEENNMELYESNEAEGEGIYAIVKSYSVH